MSYKFSEKVRKNNQKRVLIKPKSMQKEWKLQDKVLIYSMLHFSRLKSLKLTWTIEKIVAVFFSALKNVDERQLRNTEALLLAQLD